MRLFLLLVFYLSSEIRRNETMRLFHRKNEVSFALSYFLGGIFSEFGHPYECQFFCIILYAKKGGMPREEDLIFCL